MDMNDLAPGHPPQIDPRAVDGGPVPADQGLAAGTAGVVVGELLALVAPGQVPLVTWSTDPGRQAVRARSMVDLHRRHIGGQVVLVFEQGDAARPIVAGVLRPGPIHCRPHWPIGWRPPSRSRWPRWCGCGWRRWRRLH